MQTIENFNDNLNPSLKLSVITVCAKIQQRSCPDIEQYLKSKYQYTTNDKKFNNCIMFKINLEGCSCSCKLFSNGSIQLVGLKSIETAHKLLEEIKAIDCKTVMINCSGKIQNDKVCVMGLNLMSLKNFLNKDEYKDIIKYATYNPEQFSAINIKSHNCSAFVFRTGTINIIGQNTEHISSLYNNITAIYNNSAGLF